MTESSSSVIMAVDQGTSSTKVVAIDETGAVVGWSSVALSQEHPHPGWVEQDADAIVASVITGIERVVCDLDAGLDERVVAVAISSQRESAVAWDRATGRPLGPMLGWQDRRTVGAAQALESAGHGERVREITGLPIDPMFSALKFAWLLDAVDPDRSRSAAGEIMLGTVDSWLVHALTGEHRIEVGNASRTQLLDLDTLDWSDELLELFRVPRAALPLVVASDAPSAPITAVPSLPDGTRIAAVLGDSHAALFGHGARMAGAVKVTLGTGSSIMGLLEADAPARAGLVKTVAWGTPDAAYAFEGNILSTGATLVWLAELLEISTAELVELAESVPDAGVDDDPGASGIDLVPAFAGLGAPWWDDTARAVITGFDLGTSRATLARAAVESIALQIDDVLAAAEQGAATRFETILIDGGPAANDWLAQLLADLSQRRVQRPDSAGLSALGAVHLAGIATGVWLPEEVLALGREATVFVPRLDPALAAARRARWHTAVRLSRGRASAR